MDVPSSTWAIITVTVVGMGAIVCVVCCICYRLRKKKAGYSQVRHTLDAEEQRFKQNLELQGDQLDQLFDFDGDADAEAIAFDHEEMEQLKLLEDYRDRLINGAENGTASAAGGGGGSGAGDGGSGSSATDSDVIGGSSSAGGASGSGDAGVDGAPGSGRGHRRSSGDGATATVDSGDDDAVRSRRRSSKLD